MFGNSFFFFYRIRKIYIFYNAQIGKNVKENVMYRRIRIFLNLLAQGVLAENMRNSSGGGAYDSRLINIDRAMT